MIVDSIDVNVMTRREWCLSSGVIANYWEDGTAVVFHRPSGSTHQLSPLGAFLIDTLSQNPCSEVALQSLCVEAFDSETLEEVATILSEALLGLQQLSLVECVEL